MVKDSKIKVISEYEDNASAAIDKSFTRQAQATDRLVKEFRRMRTDISKTMDTYRRDVKKANDEAGQSMRKNREETERTRKEFDRFRIATEGLRRNIGALRNNLLLFFFIFRPFIDFLKQSVDLYQRQEDATNRLNASLERQGTFTERVSFELRDLSGEFQNVTRYGDEAIQEVFSQLIDIGNVLPRDLERVTQATLNFSAATGRDLRTSAQVISKAMAGFTGQLSRYGIIIGRNIPATEKANKTLEFLERRFGGAAQRDVQTYSGRIQQLSNRYGDLKEAVGRLLVERGNLDEFVDKSAKFFETLTPNPNATRLDLLNSRLKETEERISSLSDLASGSDSIPEFFKRVVELGPFNAKEAQQQIKALNTERFILNKRIQQEIEFTEKLAGARRNADPTNAIDTESIVKTVSDFSKAFDDFQSNDREIQIKLVDERFKAFEELVERRSEIENQFAEERIRLESLLTSNITSEQSKVVEAEIRSLDARQQSYEQFINNVGDLDRMRRDETFKILGQQFDFIKSFGQNAERALSDGFFNVVNGRFRELEDVVVSFGQTLLREITNALAAQALFSVSGGIFGTNVFGGLFGHGGMYVRPGMATSTGVSSGGRNRMAPYIGKMHDGGEVNATLKSGEGVLNERGMQAIGGAGNLDKLNAGQGMGGPQVVNQYYIQAIDVKSFRQQLNEHGDIYAGASERGIADNRQIRKTVQRYGT